MSGAPSPLTFARIYPWLVIVTGAAVLVMRLPATRFDQPWLFLAVLAAGLVISALKIHVPLRGGASTLSMSYFTDFLALVLLGADQGMLVAGASAASQCLFMSRGRPSVRRTLFSVAALVITVQITGLTATALGGFSDESTLLALARVTVLAASTFFMVNSFLVATVIALSRQEHIGRTWYDNFLWTAPACFVGALLAVLSTQTSNEYAWTPVLAAGPLFATLKAYRIYFNRVEEHQRHLKEVSDLHLASVEALARAIDARDQTIDQSRSGENHIRRVQACATYLGEAAGMSSGDIEALRIAALLHDIGKLAVPEYILTKPGPLTSKEFARVRIHPIVGAEIIKAVPFPYPVAPLIRSHHERWDGSGYPDGLRGEQTPLGARVLAVVDWFDAISSTRPYHEPASRQQAIATLQAAAGRALDPSLVKLFISILPTLEADGLMRSLPEKTARSRAGAAPVADLATERDRSAASWVFRNISRATQEMRELHEIAQTLGTQLNVEDTMALLTSKLNRLVPGSCWALYLLDRTGDILRCRFASGLSADVIAQMTIPVGEGASGWAARNRTALLNARGAADFEAAGVPISELPFESALAYPLVDADEVIGTITVYHVERGAFREDHRHVLEHISAQAASALRNAVTYERMRNVSFTDSLTELPNSRALNDFLRERIAGVRGDPGRVALIMIDIDDFKAVNDGHGHQKGDAALHAVAKTIREHIRSDDFCARYGGDEFVVVLQGCDRTEAELRASHLQDAVARVQLDTMPGVGVSLAISVGVSVFPDDGTTIDALIPAADHRMYLNKSGRRALSEINSLSASG